MNQNSTEKRNYCLNCDTTYHGAMNYCSNCGQARHASELKLRDIIAQFFETFFSFDGAIWRTLRDIWRPAYLSRAFVAGQRKKYVHPVRLFVITLIIFVTLMIGTISNEIGTLNQDQAYSEYHKQITQENLDSLLIKFPLEPQENLDSIKSELFNIDEYEFIETLEEIDLFLDVSSKYRITNKDVAELTINEIYEKYDIEEYYDRLIIGQSIKVNNDRKGMIRSTLGNFIWMVLLTIFITAGFMMILYIRHRPYYTELIVIMLHHHVIIFILFILMFIVNYLFSINFEYATWLLWFSALYIFLDIKFYFRQSWIKSLVKFGIVALFYATTFFFNIFVVAFSSFLLI